MNRNDDRHTRVKSPLTAILCLTLLYLCAPNAGATAAAEPANDLIHMNLQDLMNLPVYGASKFQQTASDAPASVSIVTADDIRKYGYRTIDDVLRSLRGFYVTTDRNYSYVGVRGFNRPGDYNTRILFLVDGHRINSSIDDSSQLGTAFPVDLDLIDKIEVIRGPSSSLYGTNAFFAVINILTKGPENPRTVELAGAMASNETYEGRASYGQAFKNDLKIMLSGSGLQSGGQKTLYYKEYDDPATNNGIADHKDKDKNYHLFAKMAFQDVTLEGVHSSRKKVIPTGSYETAFNDADNYTIDNRDYLSLRFNRKLAHESDLQAQVYFDHYEYRGNYIYDNLTGNRETNIDRMFGDWWGGDMQLINRSFERHQLSAGAEYRDNFKQTQQNYYDGNDMLPSFYHQSSSRVAAFYLQDEYHILDSLIISGGVRNDHYSTFGNTTNPRLALIYRPTDSSVIKALYGRAFRAPTMYELYFNDGGVTSKASSGLKPEKIESYELVYDQQLGSNLHSTISVFDTSIRDLISQQVDPADGLMVFMNYERVGVTGASIELESVWENGFKGRISYSLQNAKDLSIDQTLSNSPRQQTKMNVSMPVIGDMVFLSLEEQYTGARTTLRGDSVGSFYITNATLFAHQFIDRASLTLSVYNVFDRKYGDPGSEEHRQDIIGQDGRTLRVKIAYVF